MNLTVLGTVYAHLDRSVQLNLRVRMWISSSRSERNSNLLQASDSASPTLSCCRAICVLCSRHRTHRKGQVVLCANPRVCDWTELPRYAKTVKMHSALKLILHWRLLQEVQHRFQCNLRHIRTWSASILFVLLSKSLAPSSHRSCASRGLPLRRSKPKC